MRKGSYKDEYAYAVTDGIEKRLNEVRNMDENLYDFEALKKMHSFIQRCIDNGNYENRHSINFFFTKISYFEGYDDTLKYFKRILNELGGWPVLREKYWFEHNFDWLQTYRILKSKNLSVPYPVDVEEGRLVQVTALLVTINLCQLHMLLKIFCSR